MLRKASSIMGQSRMHAWHSVQGKVLSQLGDLVELHTGIAVVVSPWTGTVGHVWVSDPISRTRLIHRRVELVRIFNSALGAHMIRHVKIHLRGQ